MGHWVRLTDKGLLAQLLGSSKVLLPLEQCQRLVDERQHVHATSTLADSLALHLNSSLELLNSLLVFLLVEEKLSVVVVDIALVSEVLDTSSESRHAASNGTHLVLCDTKLDVGEDEVTVEVNRFLVVGRGGAEFGKDEVELSTVVVDVRVLCVVRSGVFKIFGSGIARACCCCVSGSVGMTIDISLETHSARDACWHA